jgi:hypothetical protein
MFLPSLIQTEKGHTRQQVPKKATKQGLPRFRTFSMRASGAFFLFIRLSLLAADSEFTYPAKSAAEE